MWADLGSVKTTRPWVVMGFFNVVLNLDERVGSPVRLHEVQDFREYVADCDLSYIKQVGSFFT